MYIPEAFHIEDEELILEYIKEREFANLITSSGDKIENSHLPFYVEKVQGKTFLIAHLARANRHWETINNGISIISFLSNDTYISHTAYDTKVSVPTWNYAALTIHGKCHILNEEETQKVIIKLLKIHESEQHNIDTSLIEELSKLTVGIKFEVTKFECKFKFSQNRSQDDFLNMLKKLKNSDNNDDINTYNFIEKYKKYIQK